MNIDRLYLKSASDNDFVPADTTFGLLLKWRRLSAPLVKTIYDEIPGANGMLDSTEEYGEVFYEDRELELGCILPDKEWQTPYQNLCSRYHGKTVKIAFSNDADYYWSGRLFVSEYDSKEHLLAMTATVYPYKFKKVETVVTSSGNETVTLENGRMSVVPTVTISGAVTLAWGEYTKALSASSYPTTVRIAGLKLTEGETDVTITGSANVTFRYREGAL